MCRAGAERAIDLFGAPSSLCARCCGFYLAIAVGMWLARRTRSPRGPAIALRGLGLAVVAMLLQIASEDSFAFADAPALRLAVGAAVGLPLGFVGLGRLGAWMRRPLGIAAAVSSLVAAAAIVMSDHALFEVALGVSTMLALVLGVALVGQIARDRLGDSWRSTAKEHAS
jgi:hypothetical protein